MGLFKNKKSASKAERIKNVKSFKIGGYSVILTAIVIAIAIAVNVFVRALPATWTQIDTTSNNLYSFSDQTKNIVSNLENKVNIYWIVQSGSEDSTVEITLERYASLSSKIDVIKKDPDVSPTFISQYGIDSAENNTLVVECGDRYRYLASDEIYEYDTSNYYTTGTYETYFNGESAITSAINYVTSENQLKIYTLTGHGESELSTTFSNAVKDQNFDIEELSLLSEENVPDDAAAVLIYAPSSDISDEEKEALQTYMQGGGNVLLLTNPPKDDELTNLEALMSDLGVTAQKGIVIEADQSHYGLGMPYYLIPTLGSHDITSPLSNNNYNVLLPIAQGLTISDDLPDNVTVESLLSTSDSAYSKVAGYNMTSGDKEDGDIDGPFELGLAITDAIDDDTTSKVVWVSSAYLLDDQTNSQVSGGNEDFFVNAISWLCGQEDSISIHAKSMSYEYLTVTSSAGSLYSMLVVGIIPVIYIAIGVVIWAKRRRR